VSISDLAFTTYQTISKPLEEDMPANDDRYTAERLDGLVEQFYAGHSNPVNHEPMLLHGQRDSGRTSIQELRLKTIQRLIGKLNMMGVEHEHEHIAQVDLRPQGNPAVPTANRIAELVGRVSLGDQLGHVQYGEKEI
jgi:hypothetical protein